MFFQGIDKVSQTVKTGTLRGIELQDDAGGEVKPDNTEARKVDGGSDNVADTTGDAAGKDDKEEEEDGATSETGEMRDEELANRYNTLCTAQKVDGEGGL